jgi:hypothetical protein
MESIVINRSLYVMVHNVMMFNERPLLTGQRSKPPRKDRAYQQFDNPLTMSTHTRCREDPLSATICQ